MRVMLRRFARSEAGASAVEFALVLVPLVALLFGTIEFARAIWTREALSSVAAMGARCMGVLNANCAPSGTYNVTSTKSYVVNEAAKLSVYITDAAVAANTSATCSGLSGFSEVTITYRFQTVLPLVVTQLKDGIPITVTACFPNQPTA